MDASWLPFLFIPIPLEYSVMRFSVFLLLVFVVGMFGAIGCGGQNDASTTPTAEKQKQTDAEMKKLTDQAQKNKKR